MINPAPQRYRSDPTPQRHRQFIQIYDNCYVEEEYHCYIEEGLFDIDKIFELA